MREWIKAMTGGAYDYRKMVESRCFLGKVYLCLGLAVAAAAAWRLTVSDVWISQFYLYTGLGLAGSGVAVVRRNRKLLASGEQMTRMEIREKDERNRQIGTRSWAMAGYTMLFLLYGGAFLAASVSEVLAFAILMVEILMIFLVILFQFMFRRLL